MSHIACWRRQLCGLFGIWHHGVLLPDNSVVHFKVKEGGKRTKPIVQRTSFVEFAGGYTVYDVLHFGKTLEPEEVERRALSRLGLGEYSFVFNNCESFARWCVTGHEISHQVAWLGCAPLLGILSVPTVLILHCFTPAHFRVRVRRKEILKMMAEAEADGGVGQVGQGKQVGEEREAKEGEAVQDQKANGA